MADTDDHFRARLAAILDRLDSPHDGEIVAAAGAAVRTVKAAGLTFLDVLHGNQPRRPSQAPPAATNMTFQPIRDPRNSTRVIYPPGTTWSDAVYRLVHQAYGSEAQRKFLSTLLVEHGPLPKSWVPSYAVGRAIVSISHRPPHRQAHPPG